MTTAHLVNHTHWDREWYFTTMDAQVLSEQLFTEVLDELEKNKDANFCLDGQVSVVDEYVDIHPEAKDRIQCLVAEGRLFVGPWYTQTDALIPDAESIIRNLVIGMKDTERNYGQPMKVGYLPDTFGFNAQMPTLLQQVGIDNILFWRGTNFKRQVNSVYFRWRGLGEKEAVAVDFPFGYFTGQITPDSKKKITEFVKERYDPAIKFESEHGNHQDVLVPSGIDQMNIVKDIGETIKNLNEHSQYHTVLDTYPDFVALVRREKAKLPVYQGELRLPTYARVHRTIGSVRHRIKQQSFALEQKILKVVEPLCVIGGRVGIHIGNGLLIKLWKKLLECQAHDTLGGSVSDNVTVDILHRFKEANELADGIKNMVQKKIAEFLHLTSSQVLFFNNEPYSYKGKKTVKVVAHSKHVKILGMKQQEITAMKYHPRRKHILIMTSKGEEFRDEPEYFELEITGHVALPGLGYKVFNVTEEKSELPQLQERVSVENQAISLGTKKLLFQAGKINLIDGKREVSNILSLVDSANDGDTYDYSPLSDEAEIELPFKSARVLKSSNGDLLCVKGTAELPATLADYSTKDPQLATLTYSFNLRFDENGQIRAHLSVDNQVESHRLRLKFSPQIETNAVVAQIQAGYVQTTNKTIPENWNEEFVEKPVNIYNFDKSVTLAGENKHFTFWGYGQKEYEYADQQLFITLLATTGELGKPNLAWRPGRASGDTTSRGHIMMHTPLAQELGTNEFDFAFCLSDKKFTEAENNKFTRQWLVPNVSYQSQELNYFINRLDNKIWETDGNPEIPAEISLLDLPEDIDISALYPSYTDPDSYILRVQNLTRTAKKIPEVLLAKGEVVNALEERQNETEVAPYDLLSVKVKL